MGTERLTFAKPCHSASISYDSNIKLAKVFGSGGNSLHSLIIILDVDWECQDICGG